MTPAIITLGAIYRLSGNPRVLAVLTHGKKPRYTLNRRLAGSGCSARAWKRYQDRPARSLVTILATSSRVVACNYFRTITWNDWKKLEHYHLTMTGLRVKIRNQGTYRRGRKNANHHATIFGRSLRHPVRGTQLTTLLLQKAINNESEYTAV